jgi:osmoprotectant transport system substrate-binding protein
MAAVRLLSMFATRRTAAATLAACTITLSSALGLANCGGASSGAAAGHSSATRTSTSTGTSALPGTGRPLVTIGDKNFTEQFVLGELYSQALRGEGFTIVLNRNIGPTEVTFQALESGRLGMYPEYLSTWNKSVAGYKRSFRSWVAAYHAGQRYALAHGLELLAPTQFSDTDAIGVTRAYASQNHMKTLDDLRRVAQTMTLGAPPQFQQNGSDLPAAEQLYGFVPGSFKPLDIGAQYQALDQGSVQAADVRTTDGQLTSSRYTVLRDPLHAFGWGNAVPVVSAKVLMAEGPAFAGTINRVSALLSTAAMRQLNAAVDSFHQDPAVVAKRFLVAHGVLTASSS